MTIDTLSVQPRLINDPVDTADGAMPRQGETGVHDEDRIFIDYPIVRAGTDTPETIDMLPFDDASAQTEIEIEDEILEPSKALERLRWVVDELGFAPTSRREMTLAFGIYNTKLGISKYLNNVLGHQLKSFIKYLPEAEAEAKAAAAVKKITRQIKDFALDGRGNITMLGLLGREPGVLLGVWRAEMRCIRRLLLAKWWISRGYHLRNTSLIDSTQRRYQSAYCRSP